MVYIYMYDYENNSVIPSIMNTKSAAGATIQNM